MPAGDEGHSVHKERRPAHGPRCRERYAGVPHVSHSARLGRSHDISPGIGQTRSTCVMNKRFIIGHNLTTLQSGGGK